MIQLIAAQQVISDYMEGPQIMRGSSPNVTIIRHRQASLLKTPNLALSPFLCSENVRWISYVIIKLFLMRRRRPSSGHDLADTFR